MNILHIIDERWDSGISHYALMLARGLVGRGHRVIVAALPGAPPYNKSKELGIPVINAKNIASLYWCTIKDKIEVINAHTGSGHSKGALIGKIRGIPVVRTRGDARPTKPKPFGRRLYKDTACIITPSETLRLKLIKDYQLPSSHVVTVYQGIEGIESGSHPAENSSDSDGPVIGIVARLDPVKGHRYFLDAASRVLKVFPKAKFVIAGKEANITMAELESMIKFFGIAHAVEIKGFVHDVAALMRKCTIGVIASTDSEAVSRVCLEWMAYGKPVVATMVGSIPELVEDGTTGFLVPAKDPERLSQAVINILRDSYLGKCLADNSLARVRKEFSMERFISQTEEIYRSVIKG